ncbi:FtsW/RodA/SpoVE family cell cycle protein [Actinomyces qiguomingii]|uniref:FtsW/RodA/SpoVE family cell cycle protein n=1 Tax=Actinomyces qiguomingii TaxID=2057800 RepID=UPI000CA08DB4|nr:putative peptidoglycan glycosyltransferase FtsW [Actinomyces qiguomingii]
MTPSASRPAAVPASASSRRTGRWAEAGLLVVALVIGLAAFILTAVNRTGSSPARTLQLTAALVIVCVVVHLWVRRTAPWADPVLLPTAVALNGIGLAMIHRLDMSYERLGQTHDYGPKQTIWTALGVILFCLVLLVRDYRLLRRWDNWAMWGGLAFLVLPFVPGLGTEVNGARIWIRLGPMSFQPAELTKVALAVFFASYLVSNRDNLALAGRRVLGMNLPRARHLAPLLVVWGVSIVVLVLQRDLGSSVLLFGLFIVTLYVATDRPSWLVIGAMLFLPAAWFAATHLSHVQQRITAWLNAMDVSVYEMPGGSWQLVTGLFGMAYGGLMGTGWGQGYPNLTTFANSDFIVASLGEELGLTGTLAILMLYLILVQRGLRTALALRDGFGKLLATALSFTIALQVFVVVGGVTRLIPLTGLTTPFLAYGGSSLIANWIILALLLRLSDAARRPATAAPRIIDTADLPSSLRKQIQEADDEDSGPPAFTPGPPASEEDRA